jgi:hypothetical protein
LITIAAFRDWLIGEAEADVRKLQSTGKPSKRARSPAAKISSAGNAARA